MKPTPEELRVILEDHAKWRREEGGQRANLAGANLAGANLARADLADANLAGAYLARADLADANLARANLARANLADAYLARAYLARAYLAGADLAGAYLAGAYLAGAYLAGAKFPPLILLARVTRTDGHEFFGWGGLGGVCIRAGCRTLTLAQYRAHVAESYPGTPRAEETLAIIDFIEARARAAEVAL